MNEDTRNQLSHAAYLSERLPNNSWEDHNQIDQIDDRIDEWKGVIPTAVLQQRLAQQRMTLNDFKSIISIKRPPLLHKRLEWLETLEYILESYDSVELDDQTIQPLLAPFMEYAIDELERDLIHISSDRLDRFSLFQSIRDGLYQRLYSFSIKTVMLEVKIASLTGVIKGSSGEERFRDFMHRYKEDSQEHLNFFLQYPVLARLLVECTGRFIDTTSELIQRFDLDYKKIQSTFNGTFHCLSKIDMGMGDTHQGGRSVTLLQFNSGDTLVYKPRALTVDEHFHWLLSWLNQKGFSHPLSLMSNLNCEEYGWQEYVNHKRCKNQQEVSRFYYRQGGLAALFYVLGSSDFHAENIIAHGEDPIPVDLETLFSKNLEMIHDLKAQSHLMVEINTSVYASMMLTTPMLEQSPIDLDLSAIGARGNQESKKLKTLQVEDEGTDSIRLVPHMVQSSLYKNRPKIEEGDYSNPTEYIKDIEAGFKEMYRLLDDHKQELLSSKGPIESFKYVKIRQVFRSTQVYHEFLFNSLHPDYLQNGLSRVRLFDHLWQMADQSLKFVELTSLETEELLRHDIPYFYFYVGERDIYDSQGHSVQEFFETTILDDIRTKIQNLGPLDFTKQCQYLRWSISSLAEDAWDTSQRGTSFPMVNKSYEQKPENFLEEAYSIGESMKNRAIVEDDQEVNWLGLNVNESGGVDVGAKDRDLYDGLMGYGLFFAHLARETGDQYYATLSKRIIDILSQKMETMTPTSLSIFHGEGANIYGFAHLGLLWEDKSFIQQAVRHLPVIQGMIHKHEELDVVSGVSGLIIVCLQIYRHTGITGFLQTAEQAGQKLLAYVQNTNVYEAHMHTGLAHGAAGYAWALMDLGQMIKDASYTDAAQKMYQYENSKYDVKAKNWKDQRSNLNRGDQSLYWCHGAPGIGLSRLMMNEKNPHTFIENDVQKAIDSTVNAGLLNSHCLCHGSLGNIDILLLAAEKRNDRSLQHRAIDLGYQVMVQKQSTGWISGLHRSMEMDGLMLGRTGIGYGLLRLWNPNVPSILAFQLPGKMSD